jgi:hypothetical protein
MTTLVPAALSRRTADLTQTAGAADDDRRATVDSPRAFSLLATLTLKLRE